MNGFLIHTLLGLSLWVAGSSLRASLYLERLSDTKRFLETQNVRDLSIIFSLISSLVPSKIQAEQALEIDLIDTTIEICERSQQIENLVNRLVRWTSQRGLSSFQFLMLKAVARRHGAEVMEHVKPESRKEINQTLVAAYALLLASSDEMKASAGFFIAPVLDQQEPLKFHTWNLFREIAEIIGDHAHLYASLQSHANGLLQKLERDEVEPGYWSELDGTFTKLAESLLALQGPRDRDRDRTRLLLDQFKKLAKKQSINWDFEGSDTIDDRGGKTSPDEAGCVSTETWGFPRKNDKA